LSGSNTGSLLHPGEIKAQSRFGSPARWNDERLARFYKKAIDEEAALWIENLPFCFIATADKDGHCDCSYRGRETGPLVQVENPSSLLLPDYSGNRLYNSLGNMLVNPHVGMLFIDFEAQARMRVNGKAEILEIDAAVQELWPRAERCVRISVEQVYGNCRQRIPRMALVASPVEWEA
jgi:predicted pyridoxine 5'-phosphate oxidase superfamily flavin-nucleotide-binding protein